jgi:hypothetical protein
MCDSEFTISGLDFLGLDVSGPFKATWSTNYYLSVSTLSPVCVCVCAGAGVSCKDPVPATVPEERGGSLWAFVRCVCVCSYFVCGAGHIAVGADKGILAFVASSAVTGWAEKNTWPWRCALFRGPETFGRPPASHMGDIDYTDYTP